MCAKEGFDNWDARIPHLEEKIAGYDPDLLGVQELGGDQDLDQFLAMFPQYECISYRFGKWAYGDAALFFRADRFEALDSGQFWLSPHPALPFGFAWKPLSMPRYVNWVYLRQKSNDFRFLYLNTHFDNNGPNKETAARFFAKVFRPIAERMPIIATGDFNTPTTSDRYKNIKGGDGGPPFFVDAADLVAKKEVISNIPSGTASHKIEEFIDPAQSIDHVFLAGPNKAEVGRWVEDANVYGPQNRWPSDHPAIYAEVDLKLQ
jgi:endonuclease/exonuclease/phosphatase family metal-dependent hydrolase